MSSKLEKLQMQDTVDFLPSHILIAYHCEMNLLELKPKLLHCLSRKAGIPFDIIRGKYTTLTNDEINYTERDMQIGRLKTASSCITSGSNKIILIEQDSLKEIMMILENDDEETFTRLQTIIDSVSNYGNKLSNNCFHLQWTKMTFVKQCYSNISVNELPTDSIKVKDAMFGNIIPWRTASKNNITPPFVHATFFTNEPKENSKVIFASLFCKLEAKEKLQEISNIKLHNVYLPGFFRNKDGDQNVDRIMELMFSSLIRRTIVSLSSYEITMITPLHNFVHGVIFKVIDIVDLVPRLFNRIRNMTDYMKKCNSFSIQNNRINRNDEATYKHTFVHRYLQRKRQRMSNLTISLLSRNLELTMLVFTLGLLTSASCQDINVSWNMKSNMTLFKKTAELTCVISDYDHSCNRTLRQWYGGNPYVFLCRDGACRHQGKYVEKQDSMCKYTLKIYNFSENDVNCDYTCAYGVHSSRKMLKLDTKHFAYVPTMDEVKYIVQVDKVMLNASVYIPKSFPEPSCQASFAGSKISAKSEISSIGDLYKTVITINYIPSVTICEGVLEIKCMIGSSVFTPVFDNITVCTVTSDKKSQPTESNTAVYVVVGIFIAIVVVIALYMVKKIHKGKGLTKTCRKCTGYHQSPTEEERNV